MLGCNVMVIQKLFDIWVGCDNMVGVLIWHLNLRSCMHACMKWVCSFKALVRVSEMGLRSITFNTYLGCWYVIHVCWFKSLEYHWRINIVFVQATAGREVTS